MGCTRHSQASSQILSLDACSFIHPSRNESRTHTSQKCHLPSLLLTPASILKKPRPISQLFLHKSSHFLLPLIIHAWVLPSLSWEDVTAAGALCPSSLLLCHKPPQIQVAWSSHLFCPVREGDREGILDSTRAWWGLNWGWRVSFQGSSLNDRQVVYLLAGISVDLLPRSPGTSPFGPLMLLDFLPRRVHAKCLSQF